MNKITKTKDKTYFSYIFLHSLPVHSYKNISTPLFIPLLPFLLFVTLHHQLITIKCTLHLVLSKGVRLTQAKEDQELETDELPLVQLQGA